MSVLRVILSSQLNFNISSLADVDKQNDIVLMCEPDIQMFHVKHHKKKIVFLLSAMRHFAAELKSKKFNVIYIKIGEKHISSALTDSVKNAISKHSIKKIVITQPTEYITLQEIQQWDKIFDISVEIRINNLFLSTQQDFESWAAGRKNLRMEFFYRQMRIKHNILMDGNQPKGGKWNYDAENRKCPPQGSEMPLTYQTQPDSITTEVIEFVNMHFNSNFGDAEPFHFAVTRQSALKALDHFIAHRLQNFGKYQDAMLQDEPWMYHSHISFYLNCSLLEPMECIAAVENAYRKDHVPLNAAEGFIRQVLGWREYVHGIYWSKMPSYKLQNHLDAKRTLPEFYWTAKTDMNCLHHCVKQTKQHAYAHHIQRLMVLGNFALILQIDPIYVNEWYLIVYADAFEWVELPNVSGMILFADGGYLASKPYAASGSYINKMSDYCKSCKYDVRQKTGDSACPFNYLYWNFLLENKGNLETNPRLKIAYHTLNKMSQEQVTKIKRSSKTFIDNLK